MNMQELFCKCCHELYLKLRSEDYDPEFDDIMEYAVHDTSLLFNKALKEFSHLSFHNGGLYDDEEKRVHVIHHNLNNCLD